MTEMTMTEAVEMLRGIIPDEHADAAQGGEWDEFGFCYTFDGDYYLVQYYRKPW